MSHQVASDQPVTKGEFSRLEKKVDTLLMLMESQIPTSSSRSTQSGGLSSGVYDEIIDPGLQEDKNESGATSLDKDTKQDNVDDDDFIVLEESSSARTDSRDSQTYKKEVMREMMIPASSSQTVMQERELLEDIHNMNGRILNQLSNLGDAITDVLSNLQNSQNSEKNFTSASRKTTEELKDQITEVIWSAADAIKANIGAELIWFKEQVDDTVKSQAGQDMNEIRTVSQGIEKCILTLNQDMHTSISTILQELQNSATVTAGHFDKILEDVRKSSTELSEDIQKSKGAIAQEVDASSKTVTSNIRASQTVMAEQVGQTLEEFKTSNTSGNQDMKKFTEEIKKEIDKSSKSLTQTVQDSVNVMAGHLGQVVQEVNASKTALSQSVQKSTETIIKEIDTSRSRSNKSVTQEVHASSPIMAEQVGQILKEVKASNTSLNQNIQKSSDKITQELHRSQLDVVQKIQTSASSVHQTLDQSFYDVKASLTTSRQQAVGEIQKTVESHGETMKNDIHKQLDRKMKENTKKLEDNIDQLKREVFAFIEKECQIVRDRIEGPLPSHKLYTLDFYVEDYKFLSLIKSGACKYSPLWHINQFKSSLQGKVCFHNDGKLKVWMVYGRHPREVGLQPRQCGEFKIRATITDRSGKLPDIEVGEKTVNFNEESVTSNRNRGEYLGMINCKQIQDAGYSDTPGYGYDSVLVRYLVEVLEA